MSKLKYRQVHLDFHTSEFIPEVAAQFDAEKFADTIAKAHVDSITCFARCHHGWLYYASKHHPELIHPNLVNHNLLRDQIEACHARGIRVPVYTTAQWDGLIMREHPEWLAVDGTGSYINSQGVPEPHFYYTICLNSGYRAYFKDHLQDVIDSLGGENIDGFFIDILFRTDCKCPQCVEKMKAMGYNPEVREDRGDYSIHMLEDFKSEMTAFIHERIPEAGVFYNGSHVGPASKHSFRDYTHLELESLPSGGWGYDHFPATVRYARTLGKELIGMTGKFHTHWGDFHSLKNKAALEFECFQMLANGAGCSIGDQLDPRGILSPGGYDLIGSVYAQVEAKEPYCIDARPHVEIGILTPEEFYRGADHALGIPPALVGAVRMLQELSYQFDVVDSTSDLCRYGLLILPDDIEYSPEVEERIRAYIQQGGKVLGSYKSLLDTTGKERSIYGVRYEKDSAYYRDFILPNNTIGRGLYKEEYVMYLSGAETKAEDAQVLMDSIRPYFNREGKTFCSHQHAPSSGVVGYPAVTQKGDIVYFAHPIFRIYRKNCANWCKEILRDALERLLPRKLVSHNGPSTVITTLTGQEGRDIVHVLHYIPEKRSQDIYTIEDVIPLYALSMQIWTDGRSPVSVTCVPAGTPLEFRMENGFVKFTLPKLNGHEMICLQY